jgi:peptide/nickel transport system substrate-binding protein
VAALSAAFAGCGSSSDDGQGSSAASSEQLAAPTAPPEDAQQGGTLTVFSGGDVDYIDPGSTYYQFGYMVTSATQSPLLAFAPADIEQPTPLLATEAPTVSSDGKTITYTIRDDVRFSSPAAAR